MEMKKLFLLYMLLLQEYLVWHFGINLFLIEAFSQLMSGLNLSTLSMENKQCQLFCAS